MTTHASVPGQHGPAPVTHYSRADAPRVYLKSDSGEIGWVKARGPCQSHVIWPDGGERYVPNDWLVEIEDDKPCDGVVACKLAKHDGVICPDDMCDDQLQLRPSSPSKRKAPPDNLGAQVAEHCDDLAELRTFAKANGCWGGKYASLPNPGLVRMNVVNRLRARVRKGHQVEWVK